VGLFVLFVALSSTSIQASELARQAKEIVAARSCAHCHTTGLPTAKRGALAVFDLSSDDWYSGMSGRQLRSLQDRLFTTLSPAEARENAGAAPDPDLTASERSIILAFVQERSHQR
jgi:hypothetical protein